MTEKDAINILMQAASIGQKHGIYSLKDSAMIYQAICTLNPEAANDLKDEQEYEKEKAE